MPAREFLGWDRPGLQLAADWLTARHGAAMGALVVALPGSQAGRRLPEMLAERFAGPGTAGAWQPPEIITVGHLLDRMVCTRTAFAGRLVRTLTWARALSDQPAGALSGLMAQPPAPDDFAAWLGLSEEVRSLHGELAAEGIDFEAVRAVVATHAGAAEAGRWETLSGVQGRYQERLAELGLADPHDARRAALEAGALDEAQQVVVIGAVELSRLQRDLLDRLGERATVLVFAPGDLADTFDQHGCVRAEAWKDRHLPLDLEHWSVVDEPKDQAARAASILSRWGKRLAGEQISIGVPDSSVTPYLERRLAEDGVPARVAAGIDLPALGPWRLLEAVQQLLGSRRYAALAALVRHPDLSAVLPTTLDETGRTPVECVDHYAQRHLPDRVPRTWLGREDERRAMRALSERIDDLLGDLGSDERRPLPLWTDPILALLEAVYGGRELDVEREEQDRVLHAALVALRRSLDEIAALDGAHGADLPLTAPLALHLLLRSLASTKLAPRPAAPLPAAQPVELIGWLELALDDAPALVITGFNENHVPKRLDAPSFLPDRLRRELSMADAEQREARDAYTLALVLSSGRRVELISGRRGVEGDPLRPSRLVFHRPEAEIVERVRRFLAVETAARPALPHDTAPAAPRPTPAVAWPAPNTMRVTSFRLYLQSPLLFYLAVVRRLEGVDDDLHELDPLHFGTLAHAVLQDFGNSELKDSEDEAAVRALLDEQLDRRAAAAYGRHPLPAIVLQVEQLRRRLGAFARWQVGQAAQGWRTVHVEWAPEGGQVPFVVDGEPIGLAGRIDRVDVHADGSRWRLLDYKTSERVSTPRQAHGPRRRDGRWRDLQLPLYEVLAQPLAVELAARGFEPRPGLGYVLLPRDVEKTGERMADWEAEERAAALDAAAGVVLDVRAGRFDEPGELIGNDPILAALAGEGLLGASRGAAEEDDDPEDGAA